MGRFDGFVLFAEMRTGSNFLEDNLARFPGLMCHGEAFNPVFLGQPGRRDILGVTLGRRRADPVLLLDTLKRESPGVPGFRFFHDHDSRALDAILPDPRMAKIVLTRNPLAAHISRRIAQQTGQWRLTDTADRRAVRIHFDTEAFRDDLDRQLSFRTKVQHALQVTGQSAFHIGYEQIGDLKVVNGLGRFLGESEGLSRLASRLIRQNPGPLTTKVENPAEMEAALESMGLLHLLDPQDPAVIPPHLSASPGGWLAAPRTPLLFQPLKGGPTAATARWLAGLDGVGPDGLSRGFDGRSLRQWKNRNKGSRSFTIVTHPVERAFAIFARHILPRGPEALSVVRHYLVDVCGVPLPDHGHDLSRRELHAAFTAFLRCVRQTLAGQTGLRIDPGFVPQVDLLRARSGLLPPDMVVRADQLETGLMQLCQQVGRSGPIPAPAGTCPDRQKLSGIYDSLIEAAARSAFNPDYMAFGFRDWRA